MNNTITKIQLVGNMSGYLDVDKNVPAPLTFSISDIRDISKRNGSFSKTITLPGTKNNNELMNFYFDLNVVDGNSFQGQMNINKIQKCILLQDNIPLHENELYLQLISVNKVQNNLTEDDEISYDVVLRDDVGEFFIRISNKELTDLDFSEFDHIINPTTIINSFTHTYLNGYKYILPFKDDSRFWTMDDVRPALYVRNLFDKIHSTAGFTYEWFNNQEPDFFNQLIIPYLETPNRSIEQTVIDNKVHVFRLFHPNALSNAAAVGPIWILGRSLVSRDFNYPFEYNVKYQDNLNSFTPFPGNTWVPQVSTTNFNFKIKLSFEHEFRCQSLGPGSVTVSLPTPDWTFHVKMTPYMLDTTSGNRINFPTKDVLLQKWDSCGAGGNCIFPITSQLWPENFNDLYNEEITIPGTTLLDNWIFEIDLRYEIRFLGQPDITGINGNVAFRSVFQRRNANLIIELDTNQIVLNQNIFISDVIEQGIKQSDFLKSIYTMYNLYVKEDKVNPNRLIYYFRDDFYRSGKNLDWTEKMARDYEQKVEFLPELLNKELFLTYKPDDDNANEFYRLYQKKTFGELKRVFDNEYVKGSDRKELIFSPTPGGISQFNHYLPYLELGKNIRILIDNGVISSLPVFMGIISAYTLFGLPIFTSFSNYPFISHLNKPTNANFDLNFGNAEYYFYNIGAETLNNLGNLYWLNTLNQIDKGRMMTAYFYLTPADINEVELNDTIRIDNSYWNINKIIDYDASSNDLTKVELISYNELLPLPVIPDFEREPEEPEEPEG